MERQLRCEREDGRCYMLVYQCGIANVFRVTYPFGDQARSPHYVRVVQSDYRTCEWFVRGVIEAGENASVWHSDVAGDVILCPHGPWKEGKGDLWADKKNPPALCEYA